MVRGVLHRQSNAWLGKIENGWRRYCQRSSAVSLPEALRNAADYLEQKQMQVLHPVGATQLLSKFRAKNKSKKIEILVDLGFEYENIADLTAAELMQQYKKHIQKNKYES